MKKPKKPKNRRAVKKIAICITTLVVAAAAAGAPDVISYLNGGESSGFFMQIWQQGQSSISVDRSQDSQTYAASYYNIFMVNPPYSQ